MLLIKKVLNKISTFKFRNEKFKKIGSSIYVEYDYELIGSQNIIIGDRFSAKSNLLLQAWSTHGNSDIVFSPSIVIGDNVAIMSNCHISCISSVIIHSGCLIGDNVFITDNFHGDTSFIEIQVPPQKRQLSSKGPVEIGENVWIGRNVCIMPGVSIGNGSIIGANSVVTHDIPSLSIAAGVPARIIKRS